MSDLLMILESLSKTSNSLLFPFFILKSEPLALLFAQSLFFKKSDHERIAPVAHYKRATMSEFPTLLYSLLTVEDFNLSIKLHVFLFVLLMSSRYYVKFAIFIKANDGFC